MARVKSKSLLVQEVPMMLVEFIDSVHTDIYLHREGVEGYEDVVKQLRSIIDTVDDFKERLERLVGFAEAHAELEDIILN